MTRLPLALACLQLLALTSPAAVTEIYSTDFNAFPVGDDTVVGTDGWAGNNTGLGIHGIDEFVQGLGRSVFLGGVRPPNTFTRVHRTINYDVVVEGTPVVDFEMIIGIQDADTNPRDVFFVSLYNAAGEFLAALRFDNTELNFGIWRSNGSTSTDTGDTFLRNEIMILELSIDFENNTWSAVLDDLSIFEDALFNATGKDLDFGTIAFEWALTSNLPSQFGANWFLLDELDIFVVTEEPVVGIEPFVIDSVTTSSGSPTITWLGQAGFSYQVEYSEDLLTWLATLPDSTKSSGATDATLTFTDNNAIDTARYYRIVRTPTN